MNPYIELLLLVILFLASYSLGRIRGIQARIACSKALRLVWAMTSRYLKQTWGSPSRRSRRVIWQAHDAVLEFLRHGTVQPNTWGKPIKGITQAEDRAARK